MSSRFASVVVAAGLSSRMDGFKPLLPLGSTTVLGCAVELLRAAGVESVLVVTGHRAKEILAEAKLLGVDCIHNDTFQSGMFSSVTTGLKALPDGFDGVFVLPVDIPLVRPGTVRGLMERFGDKPVLYPVFAGERGHPPLIASRCLPRILTWDGPDGLRGALAHLENEEGAGEMACADENILFDLDKPDDYREALRRTHCIGYPSPKETHELLTLYGVSERGLAHSKAVANVALAMARALNNARSAFPGGETSRELPASHTPASVPLNLPLVESAAQLHDIAKGHPGHEAEGGRILDSAGFPQAARIVEAHRDIELAPNAPLSEKEVVYLADKLVSCDRPVGLTRRFQEKLDRFGNDPQAFAAITGRRNRAMGILTRLEAETGIDIEALAAKACLGAAVS